MCHVLQVSKEWNYHGKRVMAMPERWLDEWACNSGLGGYNFSFNRCAKVAEERVRGLSSQGTSTIDKWRDTKAPNAADEDVQGLASFAFAILGIPQVRPLQQLLPRLGFACIQRILRFMFYQGWVTEFFELHNSSNCPGVRYLMFCSGRDGQLFCMEARAV
uniref:Uncharacterized protein n=1 Tax=Eutreptiella gymnastica TaxID=73025 RepID=A0A7S1JFD4_9EUGL